MHFHTFHPNKIIVSVYGHFVGQSKTFLFVRKRIIETESESVKEKIHWKAKPENICAAEFLFYGFFCFDFQNSPHIFIVIIFHQFMLGIFSYFSIFVCLLALIHFVDAFPC